MPTTSFSGLSAGTSSTTLRTACWINCGASLLTGGTLAVGARDELAQQRRDLLGREVQRVLADGDLEAASPRVGRRAGPAQQPGAGLGRQLGGRALDCLGGGRQVDVEQRRLRRVGRDVSDPVGV